jgi:formamidopyrimidine-DNA glycosylase
VPELPEVETVVRGLRELTLNRTIVGAKILGAKLKAQNPRSFSRDVTGRSVIDVRRRGKHLFVDLSDGLSLWCHLRMTGRFIDADSSYELDKHDHAYFDFAALSGKSRRKKDTTRMVWRDVRKFGHIRLLPTAQIAEQKEIVKLGVEPLEVSVNELRGLVTSMLMKRCLLRGSTRWRIVVISHCSSSRIFALRFAGCCDWRLSGWEQQLIIILV